MGIITRKKLDFIKDCTKEIHELVRVTDELRKEVKRGNDMGENNEN